MPPGSGSARALDQAARNTRLLPRQPATCPTVTSCRAPDVFAPRFSSGINSLGTAAGSIRSCCPRGSYLLCALAPSVNGGGEAAGHPEGTGEAGVIAVHRRRLSCSIRRRVGRGGRFEIGASCPSVLFFIHIGS